LNHINSFVMYYMKLSQLKLLKMGLQPPGTVSTLPTFDDANKVVWGSIKELLKKRISLGVSTLEFFEIKIVKDLEKNGLSGSLISELQPLVKLRAEEMMNSLEFAQVLHAVDACVDPKTNYSYELKELRCENKKYSWEKFVADNKEAFPEELLKTLVKCYFIFVDAERYNDFDDNVKMNPEKFPLLSNASYDEREGYKSLFQGDCVDTFEKFDQELYWHYISLIFKLRCVDASIDRELRNARKEVEFFQDRQKELVENLDRLKMNKKVSEQRLDDLERIQEKYMLTQPNDRK